MKVGIDIGGSHTAIGVINDDFEIIEQFEKEYSDEEKINILHVIENEIIDKVNNIKNKYNIEKIGIAVPGSVSNGVIIKAINLGIENYDISSKIEQATRF